MASSDDTGAGDGGGEGVALLEEEEWEYLAEGKVHVVLKYCGRRPRFVGHVLRLLKVLHAGEHGRHDPERERTYTEQVVGPLLGLQYVDGGVPLAVDPSFLKAISTRIEPLRPLGRKAVGLDLTASKVDCLRDHTTYFPPCPPALAVRHSPRITIELKPKAGFCPSSYLVSPHNRAKYGHSRYEVMQRYRMKLKEAEGMDPEWGQLTDSNLDYSPIDLFSQDYQRMLKALTSLAANPQNFLQIYVDSVQVYGRGNRELCAVEEAVAQLQGGRSPATSCLDWLMEILASVLHQEPLLSRLLTLQKMDVLDVEGAGLVLDVLEHGSGRECVMSELENAVLRPLSPERQDVDDLLSAPSGRAILPPWNDDLELKHLEASQAVGKLTAEALDLGPKPPQKIRSKGREEDTILRLAFGK